MSRNTYINVIFNISKIVLIIYFCNFVVFRGTIYLFIYLLTILKLLSMREFRYRSMLPEVHFQNVQTIIDDDSILDIIKSDRFIAAPDIVISHVLEVLKFRGLSYKCVFYYGTLITFHLIFDVLRFSVAQYIVDGLNMNLAKTSYCLVGSNILPHLDDKITFIIAISKKL